MDFMQELNMKVHIMMLTHRIWRRAMMTANDRDDLIRRLRYSSKYNTPCPEWVYKMIEALKVEGENMEEAYVVEEF